MDEGLARLSQGLFLHYELRRDFMCKKPIIFIGATAFSIAAALERPSDIIILERSAMLGKEWIASLNIKEHQKAVLHSRRAKLLQEELMKRGLLGIQGRYHMPPVSFVFANLLVHNNVDIRLWTEIISIAEADNGLCITMHNLDGISRIDASCIIDTEAFSNKIQYLKCSLCAMMKPAPSGSLPTLSDGQILTGLLPNEYVLKLPVPCDGSCHKKKAAFHKTWKTLRRNELLEWQVLHLSSEPAYDFEHKFSLCKTGSKQHWIPSASYGDLLTAFDGGALCAYAID